MEDIHNDIRGSSLVNVIHQYVGYILEKDAPLRFNN